MTTGWTVLLRANLRRDRWMLLWWMAGIVLLYWSQAVGTDATYPTQADLASAAKAMTDNPALVAMTGPARALDTIGGQVAWQASAFGAIVMGLMNMFLLGRHLRAEEESGRDELVRSAAVGRDAPALAALAVVLLADVVTATLTAGALVGYGLPVEGSVVLAAGLLGCGLVFAGVALVALQLFVGTRPAYGLTGVVIASSYVLRAVGDVGTSWLSWCSPIGWAQAMWPYSGDRWWPVLLFVPSTVALLGVAATLFSRRDVGSGVWAARPGPARGRLGAGGLVWRLQRGSVVGWALGTAAMGLAYGSLGDSVGDVVGDGRLADDVLGLDGGDVVRSFHATSIAMIALLACGFAVSSVLRLRAEETDGRAELLLSTGLSRVRWWAAHVLVSAVGSLLAVVAGGIGVGLGYALTTGDGGAVTRLGVDASGLVPAVWAVGGLALLVHGVAPRWAQAAWVGVVLCAVVMLFGALLDLPSVLTRLSPFEWLARVPAEPWDAGSFLGVGAIALVLAGAGLLGLTRRDEG